MILAALSTETGDVIVDGNVAVSTILVGKMSQV